MGASGTNRLLQIKKAETWRAGPYPGPHYRLGLPQGRCQLGSPQRPPAQSWWFRGSYSPATSESFPERPVRCPAPRAPEARRPEARRTPRSRTAVNSAMVGGPRCGLLQCPPAVAPAPPPTPCTTQIPPPLPRGLIPTTHYPTSG